MRKSRRTWIIASALGTVAGIASTTVYLRYRRETKAATQRLYAGSRLVETECGPIECAMTGDGPPVLALHGGGGGYDQGLLMAPWLGLRGGFRWIAVSRFGYLRTPLPADPSPAAQADAYAALLDTLHLPQVTVVGGSAGGPSVLQFALRHPDRCTALVLVSALCHAWSPVSFGALNPTRHLDLVPWAMATFAPQLVFSSLGISRQTLSQLPSEEKAFLHQVLESVLPLSLRQAGMLADLAQVVHLERYPLNRIAVSTLVIHAVDDNAVPFSHGQFAAESIPGARLLALDSGGHLLVGRRDELASAVTSLIPP